MAMVLLLLFKRQNQSRERNKQRKKKRQNQKKTILQHWYQKTGIIITCRLNGIPRHEGGGASARPLQRRRRAAFPGGRTGHSLTPARHSINQRLTVSITVETSV